MTMPPGDEHVELDERFPTGEWKGFFIQPDSPHRYRMDLLLRFVDLRISGTGDDAIGEFTIRGAYDTQTGECSWSKQYVGQHSVDYSGRAGERGIIGNWQLDGGPAVWSGPFFVWPKSLGDQESLFEKAFLEYELGDALPQPATV